MFNKLRTKLFSKRLNGSLGILEDEREFLIGDISSLPELEKQDTIVFEYNQGKSLDCTLYQAIGAISDLWNYEFSKEEIQEIVDLSYTQGRTKGRGRYTNLGTKCVCGRWNNKFPDKPVRYSKLELLDETSERALAKNYTLGVTYRGNTNYQLDYLKDGVLNLWDFGKKTYGHATSMIKRFGRRYIKDSYKGRKGQNGIDCNIYEVKTDMKKLIGPTYYSACYLITKEKTIDRLGELKRLKEMELTIKRTMDLNSELWNSTNDGKFKNDLHNMNNIFRNKLQDIQKEFDKLD